MFQNVPIPDYSNAGEKARLHLSLYIFNDPVHVGIHQTVGVLIFAVFKLRIEEKERRKEQTLRLRLKQPSPETLSLLLLSLSSSLLRRPLSSPSSPPYFATPLATFHYVYPPVPPPPLTCSPASSLLPLLSPSASYFSTSRLATDMLLCASRLTNGRAAEAAVVGRGVGFRN